MRYRSTRGQESDVSFEDVLFSGYASDGGLFMPEAIPAVSREALELHWAKASYAGLVREICSIFIAEEEMTRDEIHQTVERAFSVFPGDAIEVAQLRGEDGCVMVGELFHGPTMTFKDLALSVSARLMEHFLKKRGRHVTVLIGTSGDTGSAAIHALRPLSSSADVVVLLPRGRITNIQERQMTTVIADNVHVFSVDGSSDDLDQPIKRAFADQRFVVEHALCSLNSVNWARVMAQAAHFAFLYFQARRRFPAADKVRIIVPTGACGNVAGGFLAHRLLGEILGSPGWPKLCLVTAVGKNDIVHRAVSRGSFTLNECVVPTWSCAIDIQSPYNVERLLYMASNFNVKLTSALMEEFEAKGGVIIPEALRNQINNIIEGSGSYPDGEIESAIKDCFDKNDYSLCPHTAVAYKYHVDNPAPSTTTTVIVATASPAKFPEALEAAGVNPRACESIQELLKLPTAFENMDKDQNWDKILTDKILCISNRVSKVLK